MTGQQRSGAAVDIGLLADLASYLSDVAYLLQLEPELAFEYVSDSVTDVVGYTPQEHYDNPQLGMMLVDPRDLPVLAATSSKPVGEVFDYTVRWVARDGRRVWTHHRCRTQRRADGSLLLSGVARDVTALKQAEQRYRLLAENTADLVVLLGPRREVHWVSPVLHRLLGYEPSDLPSLAVADVVHPDDVSTADTALRALDELTTSTVTEDVRLRHRDGTYRWFSITARRTSDTNLVMAFRDIDDEMRARLAMRAEQELRHAVLDSMLDPLVVLQAVREAGEIVDFTYVEANQAACEYLGRRQQELVGMRLLTLFPRQGATPLFKRYAAALAAGEPFKLDEVELVSQASSGGMFFDMRVVPVSADTLSLTWRDVTERYEAARSVARSEEQFRLLAHNSSDVVIRLSHGIIRWVSPSLPRMLGWRPESWDGRTLQDFTHPEDREVLGSWRDPQPRTRLRMRGQDGSYHWVEIQADRIAGDDPGGVVASLRSMDDVVAYEAELHRRATLDDLTGALKRDEALRLLAQGRARGDSAVLFCDVDAFKAINDNYGHAYGDEVLRQVVARTQGCVRDTDVVARMGGDEFLVVLDAIHDGAEAERTAERIRAAVESPIQVGDSSVSVTMSIGVTLRRPDEDPDELISRADRAMYTAKRDGRNRVVVAL